MGAIRNRFLALQWLPCFSSDGHIEVSCGPHRTRATPRPPTGCPSPFKTLPGSTWSLTAVLRTPHKPLYTIVHHVASLHAAAEAPAATLDFAHDLLLVFAFRLTLPT